MTSKPLYLVACCSKKANLAAAPADEIYISDLFKKSRDYIHSRFAEWYILSAKYGLLHPTDVIAPYEQTLYDLRPDERQAWGDRVAKQLNDIGAETRDVIFLAGKMYRTPLMRWAGKRAQAPMSGLGIGQQKQWLARNTVR